MSHGFEVRADGSAAFVSARVPAWHTLGEVVSGLMHWSEACSKVMDFEIEKIELYNQLTGEPTGFYGLFRNDTCDMLHVVKESYEVVQPYELFAFMDGAIGAEGFHYETAGVLGKGERIFTTANVAEYDVLGSGDVHKTYLLGCNSYDGSLAETYKLTDTRVVCQNTLNAALTEDGKALKFKHTKNIRDRKLDALQFLNASLETTASMQQKMEVLAQRLVDTETVMTTVAALFGVDPTKDKLSKQKAEGVLLVQELFESNDRDAFKEFRGTAYNLVNAITEYADHFKTAESEKQRAFSALFGSGDEFKRQGVELVLELTKHSPLTNQPVAYSVPGSSDFVAELLHVAE